MNTRFAKGRALSLLLVFAMLVVSFATLLPITASADGEIQDFGYQTLSSANPNDAQTDLRFLFTIGNLDYDAVGFVFSTSNATPVAGTDPTYETTNAYSAITANSEPVAAPTGRWWVAVALSEIPLANFEDTIYVRPYVKTGEVYTHGETASIDVCTALTLDKVKAAENSIYDSKDPGGPYKSANSFRFDKQISAIRGDNHFCPTSGDNDGNDLWFEYSVLFNDSLNNYNVPDCASEIKVFGFVLGDYSDHSEFYYLYGQNYEDRVAGPKDLKSGDCKYRGHFDYSTYKEDGYASGHEHECADDLSALGNTLFGDSVGLYKAGWSGARNQSPYVYDDTWTTKGGNGWHRLGFRFHQEASIVGDTVTYAGYSELYINGTLVWRVHSNMNKLKNKNLLLWEAKTSATDEEIAAGWTLYNGAYYKDNDTMRVQYRMDSVNNSTNSVYVGIADICWTCGDGFAHPVSPASLNADKTINLGGNDYAAKIWYIYDN